jgi:hypothetical protein
MKTAVSNGAHHIKEKVISLSSRAYTERMQILDSTASSSKLRSIQNYAEYLTLYAVLTNVNVYSKLTFMFVTQSFHV